jgi:hypothetical protein
MNRILVPMLDHVRQCKSDDLMETKLVNEIAKHIPHKFVKLQIIMVHNFHV